MDQAIMIQILSKEGLFVIPLTEVNFTLEEEPYVRKNENPENSESISINIETGIIKENQGKEIKHLYLIKKTSTDLRTNTIIFKSTKKECEEKLKQIFECIAAENYNINLN